MQHHRCIAVNACDLHGFFVFLAGIKCLPEGFATTRGVGNIPASLRRTSAGFSRLGAVMAKAKRKARAKARPKSKAKAAKSKAARQKAGAPLLFAVDRTTIPIVGANQLFPVRRIYCIGRNYAAHAREMGSDPTREPPFFFQKPTDAVQVVMPGKVVDHPYPPLTNNYHYEVELVAALKSGGKNIPAARALEHVYGYALGLDMTRRDLQIG